MSNKIKKSLVSIIIMSLFLSTFVVIPTKAAIDSYPVIGGAGRVETSLEIAEKVYMGFGESTTAVIANGEDEHVVDALAVAPLAYKKKAPILLTTGFTVNSKVMDNLKAKAIKNIYLVGFAATAEAKAQLEKEGYVVTLLTGASRYETANAINKELGTTTKVAVVNAYAEIDALSVAAVAAHEGMAIVLSGKEVFPPGTTLPKSGTTVYAIGGSGVLSDSLVSKLGAIRLGGDTRYATNAAVLKGLDANLKFDTVYVANGTAKGVDALPGAVLAAQTQSPIVLVGNSNDEIPNLGAKTVKQLSQLGKNVYPSAVDAILRKFNPVAQKIQAQTISASYMNMAVIKNDGSLWAWGENKSGQLGDGTVTARYIPIKIMDNVVAVSGNSHTAVIKTDGSLWTWGSNTFGQLGDGTNTDRCTPEKVMDNVAEVSVGDGYTAVIKTDRSLWTWGANNYGQLGNGKIDPVETAGIKPTKVMDNVAKVCTGVDHTVAIKTDGSLWTWGQNWTGQLGDDTSPSRYTPKKVLDNVEEVSTSFGNTAAIRTDGSLWTWGANTFGQLGDGTNTNSYTPKRVMDNVTTVSAGSDYMFAIKTDGSLWTCGKTDIGEIRDVTATDRNLPVKVMDDVATISASIFYTAAIKTDGSLWIFGNNGINPHSNVPIKIIENVALGNSVSQDTLSYEVKNNIKVLLNNQQITFEQPPITREDQILVPAKEIFESMGANFKWNEDVQSITAIKDDTNIIMQIDFNLISRNGQQSVLDVPPQIINGKTFVSARAVADALSADYDWNENNQTVHISTLNTKSSDPYIKYEEKMKTYGFDRMYNNKRAETSEPVTKVEALKIAIAAVFNTYDISGFAAENNEYENAIWAEYAQDSGVIKEDINSSNFDERAKYIDVITYFENCKMKFLKEQAIKDTQVNLKDISKYTTEQQSAIKDMVANEVIYLLSDTLNGNENIFKGQLNELVVNFVEKYNTIAPLGERLNIDPQKMPSNADKYPYILASVDKSIYEKPLQSNYTPEELSPKELYANKKEYYPQIKMYTEEFFNGILNIDYRTITEENLKQKLAPYIIFEPNESAVKFYVKYVKDNEIVIEGTSKLQLPIIYFDGESNRARLKLTFEIKHSKTKEDLLYLDCFDGLKKTYEKTNYDILVDYYLLSAIGSNNLYLGETELYNVILDKDKCEITKEVEK